MHTNQYLEIVKIQIQEVRDLLKYYRFEDADTAMMKLNTFIDNSKISILDVLPIISDVLNDT